MTGSVVDAVKVGETNVHNVARAYGIPDGLLRAGAGLFSAPRFFCAPERVRKIPAPKGGDFWYTTDKQPNKEV